jgi:hypothetical protein
MICTGRPLFPLVLLAQVLIANPALALPARLVLFFDGVAYQDVKALQQGVIGRDGQFRQCFTNYFPASRVISTYPSASDVASTDIFGNRPLPGYQRTYYSYAANSSMFINAVTSAVEFEHQFNWLLPRGWPYAMSFVAPLRSFRWEVPELIRSFLAATNIPGSFYAYITSTDNAQHLSRDILPMLCELDRQLEQLRATYRAQQGRELEVLIFSDHGNNHTRAKRVKIRPFLKRAGYRIGTSIHTPKDVILPTAGIESWVEIHNHPSQTEALLAYLTRLQGVDVVTARAPDSPTNFIVMNSASGTSRPRPRPDSPTNFIVMNSKGERAVIDSDPTKDSFRYRPERGDPINYAPVAKKLKDSGRLDNDGFGSADAWFRETTSHHYPVALERIVHGHTCVTLNPAPIIISLDRHYVHAAFWIKAGSGLVNCGGTHGGLGHLDSTGVLLSTFAPTEDTTTGRLAALYDGFSAVRDYRTTENGAEFISLKGQALTRIPRVPLDRNYKLLDSGKLYLRVWSPLFAGNGCDATLNLKVRPMDDFRPLHIRRGDPKPASQQHQLSLDPAIAFPENCTHERVYAFPEAAKFTPTRSYRLSGWLGSDPARRGRAVPAPVRIFEFDFRTDARGRPVPY